MAGGRVRRPEVPQHEALWDSKQEDKGTEDGLTPAVSVGTSSPQYPTQKSERPWRWIREATTVSLPAWD